LQGNKCSHDPQSDRLVYDFIEGCHGNLPPAYIHFHWVRISKLEMIGIPPS
jgi:hypothetical protein